jgi:hypothetical protein
MVDKLTASYYTLGEAGTLGVAAGSGFFKTWSAVDVAAKAAGCFTLTSMIQGLGLFGLVTWAITAMTEW